MSREWIKGNNKSQVVAYRRNCKDKEENPTQKWRDTGLLLPSLVKRLTNKFLLAPLLALCFPVSNDMKLQRKAKFRIFYEKKMIFLYQVPWIGKPSFQPPQLCNLWLFSTVCRAYVYISINILWLMRCSSLHRSWFRSSWSNVINQWHHKLGNRLFVSSFGHSFD